MGGAEEKIMSIGGKGKTKGNLGWAERRVCGSGKHTGLTVMIESEVYPSRNSHVQIQS
jgi:hypothetical protein